MFVFSGRAQTEVGNLMCLCFQVELQADNAKHAQFRIMPRYKVKAEGDVVCMLYSLPCLSVQIKKVLPGCFCIWVGSSGNVWCNYCIFGI